VKTIGLISDTHGLLRPEAVAALQGSDHIIHAGDIGNPAIIGALRRVAPVTAVRSNNDQGAWADALPLTATIELEEVRILVVHDFKKLDLGTLSEDIRVIVSGHSHRPVSGEQHGRLLINPGSAGPRRFRLPISVARLLVTGDRLEPSLCTLEPRRRGGVM
jgi:hypothetical protein